MGNVLSRLLADLSTGKIKIVDLTKPLEPNTPVIALPPQFADAPSFSIEPLSRYDARGPAWYWNVMRLGEHTGTHFDAPIHWITGRSLLANSCDTIPPQCFFGPAIVIDSIAKVTSSADYLLDLETILGWETEHGRIPAGAWVLMRSDWSKRGDRETFLNMDMTGPHSPSFHKLAVELLVRQRDVLGIGVETVGIDAGQASNFDPPFPNHATVLGAGKYGLAGLCNLDQLPPTGSIIVAAPLKIVQGSGSPVRALALVPEKMGNCGVGCVEDWTNGYLFSD